MSFRIKKREDDRYVILGLKTDKVIDDCRGYGYLSRETAYYGFVLYVSKRYQKYKREQRKNEREKASSQTNRERPLSV